MIDWLHCTQLVLYLKISGPADIISSTLLANISQGAKKVDITALFFLASITIHFWI